MAPIAIPAETKAANGTTPAHGQVDISALKEQLKAANLNAKKDFILPPENTLRRYAKAGIDLSGGYPYFPPKPDFVQDVAQIQTNLREYNDPALRADPEKKALFSAATSVRNLTTNIGVSSKSR